jgi:hypothetical protein
MTTIRAWVRLTKAHRRTAQGWKTSGYGNAHWVAVESHPVAGLKDVARVVAGLARRPDACVIRGELLPGVSPARCERHYRKEPVTFREQPRQWLMVDADDVPEPAGLSMVLEPDECIEHLLGLLPEPFQDAWCFWQASASAGVKPGIRAHLWFWLSEPITSGQVKAWLRGCSVDRTVYTPIQPHYTADPLFVDGTPDPMRRRLGVRRGLEQVVEVPAGLEELPQLACEPIELTGRELTDGDLERVAAALRRSRNAQRI